MILSRIRCHLTLDVLPHPTQSGNRSSIAHVMNTALRYFVHHVIHFANFHFLRQVRRYTSSGISRKTLCVVSFRLSRFLFSDSFLYHACFIVFVDGILTTCPKYFHIVFNNIDLIVSELALLKTSSLINYSFELMVCSPRKRARVCVRACVLACVCVLYIIYTIK